MAEMTRGELWKALKEAGVQFPKHFREYDRATLQEAYDRLHQGQQQFQQPAAPRPQVAPDHPAMNIPISSKPAEYAGMVGAADADKPIRIDPETNYIWYRDEVRKPAYPKPRAVRKLKYIDTGTKKVTTQNGEYMESFEVPGDQRRESEARITLPSYQVGLYKDPNFPFKIHVYNDMRGFDYFEVQDFYGGPELVPPSVKTIYVENVLCYDMRSVIRAIETEHRQRVLGLNN